METEWACPDTLPRNKTRRSGLCKLAQLSEIASNSRRDCASHFGPNALVFGAAVFILRTAELRRQIGSKRISVRRRYAGDCDVGATRWSSMADRPSSLRGSAYRNRDGANTNGSVAGEGNHTLRENMKQLGKALQVARSRDAD